MAGLVAAHEVTDCHVAAGQRALPPTGITIAETHYDEA